MSAAANSTKTDADNLTDKDVRHILLDLKDNPDHGFEKSQRFSPFVFKRLEAEGLLRKVPAPREPGQSGRTPHRFELTDLGRKRTAGRRPANLERMVPIMNSPTTATNPAAAAASAAVDAAGRRGKSLATAPGPILAKMLDPDPKIGAEGRAEYEVYLAEQERIKAEKEANRKKPGRPAASKIDETALVEKVAEKVAEKIRGEFSAMIEETVAKAIGVAVPVALNSGVGNLISDGMFSGIDRIKEALAEIVRTNIPAAPAKPQAPAASATPAKNHGKPQAPAPAKVEPAPAAAS